MPWHLQLLTLLLAIDGAWRIAVWCREMAWGDTPSLASLGIGALFAAAAGMLWSGRRAGLDTVLLYSLGMLATSGVQAWRAGSLASQTILALSLLLALTGYLLWCRSRLPWQALGSYGQWMSDPGLRDDMDAWFRERDRVVAADRRQPPDADAVLAGLLTGDDPELVRHRVQAAPQHFGMAVLRAIGDPSFRRDPKTLAMLIDNLPETLHARSTDALVACLDHLVGHARGSVLQRLAATGDARLTPLWVRELAGREGAYVAKGLVQSFAKGRADDAVRNAIAPVLHACSSRPDADGSFVLALAHLDPAVVPRRIAAAASLDKTALNALVALGDGGFELPLDPMLEVWRKTHEHRRWFWCWRLMPLVAVPEPELRSLLAELPRRLAPSAFSAEGAAGEPSPFSEPVEATEIDERKLQQHYARLAFLGAVEQLVARGTDDAATLLERAIAMDLEDVSDGAAAAALRLHGLPHDLTFSSSTATGNHEEDLDAQHDDDDDDDAEQGPEIALNRVQRALRSLTMASSYACNGGLAHAFECLDGADLEALEPALAVIAPPSVRDVWLAARRELSPDPLPADHEQRLELILQVHASASRRLDELGRRFFADKWRLDVAIARYAMAHREELATPP